MNRDKCCLRSINGKNHKSLNEKMFRYGIISLFVIWLISMPIRAHGQTHIIQGNIIKQYGQKQSPFNSIPVTLYNSSKKSRSNPSITDSYGTYYFYNVPAGIYQLEIWINGKVDKKNPNKAKKHKVAIDYQKAVSRGNRKLLRISAIRVKIK